MKHVRMTLVLLMLGDAIQSIIFLIIGLEARGAYFIPLGIAYIFSVFMEGTGFDPSYKKPKNPPPH